MEGMFGWVEAGAHYEVERCWCCCWPWWWWVSLRYMVFAVGAWWIKIRWSRRPRFILQTLSASTCCKITTYMFFRSTHLVIACGIWRGSPYILEWEHVFHSSKNDMKTLVSSFIQSWSIANSNPTNPKSGMMCSTSPDRVVLTWIDTGSSIEIKGGFG
jgi:hypothetical protein